MPEIIIKVDRIRRRKNRKREKEKFLLKTPNMNLFENSREERGKRRICDK